MDHIALKRIYCSRKPAKMICIKNILEEISDFAFDFQHISVKHMFVSDFLSRFSLDNNDEEPIAYLTDTSLLNNDSYMTKLDATCKFNYNTCWLGTIPDTKWHQTCYCLLQCNNARCSLPVFKIRA